MSHTPQAPLFIREMGLIARFGVYALASLILIGVDTRYQTLGGLRSGVHSVLDPLQSLVAQPFAWIDTVDRFMVMHGELAQDYARLSQEGQRLRALQQDRASLLAENIHLRSLLALPPQPHVLPVAAEILRTIPDPFARKVVINRGITHGIEAGLPVVDANGLVGQVTLVSAMTAEVTLLTDHDQDAPVQNQRNGARVIVSGTGSDTLLEVRFLDLHADLKPGDLLHTSGLDGSWPAGIPVAQVMHIEPPRHTPFAHALCRPLGKVGQYRHVLVLKTQAGKAPR